MLNAFSAVNLTDCSEFLSEKLKPTVFSLVIHLNVPDVLASMLPMALDRL